MKRDIPWRKLEPIERDMDKSLTIFQKGLILIATPLAIQAVYIGMLMQTQAEAAIAERWALHTKEVIAKVEEIYRRLLEGYAAIRILVVSDDTALSGQFRLAPEQVPDRIQELRTLVRDNKAQQSRVDLASSQSRRFLDWLAAIERMARNGERGKAIDQLDAGARLLGEVRASTDEMLKHEAQLDTDRMERWRRTSARQVWILVGGGIVFLGATLALSLAFLNGLIKRLAVLRGNARRFAEGSALLAPLTGGDEIALVDRAFHEMATGLDQQKQENEMFVYSVSHDLRSPLINLQGFSEELGLSYRELEGLFRHEEIPPDVRRAGLKLMRENIEDSIRYIQTAVGRLARIIDALLRLSRAGRVEYQLQTLDLAPIVQKIIDALHDTVANKKVEIVVGELPAAWGDPTAVEQIFANLIGNAVSYLDPARAGRIEVGSTDVPSTDNVAGCRVYYVKDNGLGIPEAYHQRVFAAFNRLHANVAQGEGIGLALVRRMVERHGGKIWLESAAGVGTTFFVALPARALDGALQGALERPLATQITQGEHPAWQPSQS